jgi:hypothetical protein
MVQAYDHRASGTLTVTQFNPDQRFCTLRYAIGSATSPFG